MEDGVSQDSPLHFDAAAVTTFSASRDHQALVLFIALEHVVMKSGSPRMGGRSQTMWVTLTLFYVLVSLAKSHDCEELAVTDPSALLLITIMSAPMRKYAHFYPFPSVILGTLAAEHWKLNLCGVKKLKRYQSYYRDINGHCFLQVGADKTSQKKNHIDSSRKTHKKFKLVKQTNKNKLPKLKLTDRENDPIIPIFLSHLLLHRTLGQQFLLTAYKTDWTQKNKRHILSWLCLTH